MFIDLQVLEQIYGQKFHYSCKNVKDSASFVFSGQMVYLYELQNSIPSKILTAAGYVKHIKKQCLELVHKTINCGPG